MGQKKDWTYKIDRSDQTVDHVAFEKNEKKHVSKGQEISEYIFLVFNSSI